MIDEYKRALDKVRQVVRYFRQSPVRNSILQKRVEEVFDKNLVLTLDIKIRWNSILPMGKRYLELKQPIKLALEELDDVETMYFEDETILEEIVQALSPIAQTVLKLSEESCNLMVCEGALLYLLKKLEETDSSLGKKLFESVQKRIGQRRNQDIVTTLIFLHSGQYPADTKYLKYDDKKKVKSTILALYQRLYPTTSLPTQIEVETAENQDELTQSITNVMTMSQKETTINDEIKLLVANGGRSQKLEKVYRALLTIQATSTISERVFSIAGIFKTKIRNRLQSLHLNMLVFLKNYFFRIKK